MNYIGIIILVIALCLAAAFIITRSLSKALPLKKSRKILIFVIFAVVFMAVTAFSYLSQYSHADSLVENYLKSSETVTVTKTADGYYFDGPADDSAVIFYPGAKIEATAYAPLLFNLAAQGPDCFLVEMPFNMAVFGKNSASKLIDGYDYDKWIMMGHSLGGVVASGYAAEHPDEISELILLAAYPTADIADSVKLLSIYGSEDAVLNMDSYEKSKAHWPSDTSEVIIKGGNHSGFGNYGEQRGDGTALISAQEQQQETIEAILN